MKIFKRDFVQIYFILLKMWRCIKKSCKWALSTPRQYWVRYPIFQNVNTNSHYPLPDNSELNIWHFRMHIRCQVLNYTINQLLFKILLYFTKKKANLFKELYDIFIILRVIKKNLSLGRSEAFCISDKIRGLQS